MDFDEEEFRQADAELERILEDRSVLDEEYTEVTEELNNDPDQLIWKYIYQNTGGSLRRALSTNPPESFPVWLHELFSEEYSAQDSELPANDFINKALEYLVKRRLTA